jgi:hypothetical protein
MNSTIQKIKKVTKLTQPKFNQKYNVWIVRVKTDNGWKAIWRKEKEKSIKIYERMSKLYEKTEKEIEAPKQTDNSNSLNDWNDKMNKEEETARIPHNVNSFKKPEKKASTIVGKLFGKTQSVVK